MLPFNQEILDILTLNFDGILLRGYYGGLFNKSHDCLVGITHHWIDSMSFQHMDTLERDTILHVSYGIGHIIPNKPGETGWRGMVPIPTLKIIELAGCKAYGLDFFGALRQGEWKFKKTFSLFASEFNEKEVAIRKLEEWLDHPGFWTSPFFDEDEEDVPIWKL